MHLTFNPPCPIFEGNPVRGTPDANGSVKNSVNDQFRAAVVAFGREPDVQAKHNVQSPRKYARFFLRSYQNRDQVADVGNYVDLSDEQAQAVNKGTRALRFAVAVSEPALAADGEPAHEGGTAYPEYCTFGEPETLWARKVAELQHNLNVGADGTQTGTGAQTGT